MATAHLKTKLAKQPSNFAEKDCTRGIHVTARQRIMRHQVEAPSRATYISIFTGTLMLYTIYGYIAFSAIIEAVMILREICYLSMAIASRDNGFSIVYTAT